MVIRSTKANRCLKEIMVIASALSIQDPRERPSDTSNKRRMKNIKRFFDKESDFMAFVNLWDYIQQPNKKSWRGNQFSTSL